MRMLFLLHTSSKVGLYLTGAVQGTIIWAWLKEICRLTTVKFAVRFCVDLSCLLSQGKAAQKTPKYIHGKICLWVTGKPNTNSYKGSQGRGILVRHESILWGHCQARNALALWRPKTGTDLKDSAANNLRQCQLVCGPDFGPSSQKGRT